jgi:hypothetical protein
MLRNTMIVCGVFCVLSSEAAYLFGQLLDCTHHEVNCVEWGPADPNPYPGTCCLAFFSKTRDCFEYETKDCVASFTGAQCGVLFEIKGALCATVLGTCGGVTTEDIACGDVPCS